MATRRDIPNQCKPAQWSAVGAALTPHGFTKSFGAAILRTTHDNRKMVNAVAAVPRPIGIGNLEGGIMSRHPGSARRLWLCGIIIGLTLGLGLPVRAQRADRPAPDDPAAAEEAPRAARHGAVPLAPREEPQARHRPRPRLRLPRRTRHARCLHQVLPRPYHQGPQGRRRLADPRTPRIPARPGRRRRRRAPPGRDPSPRATLCLPITSVRPSSWSASPNRPPTPSSAPWVASRRATT